IGEQQQNIFILLARISESLATGRSDSLSDSSRTCTVAFARCKCSLSDSALHESLS
ncbi:hypothetical protein A2U01_0110996, partial [Trifolium medium]|nr:hypothetical protein [Trifolium medium]